MANFAQRAAEAVKEGKVQEADFEGAPDFTYEPPAAGKCVGRLVSVVEIGKHPQRAYGGKEQKPAHEMIIQFELLGKKHRKEINLNNESGESETRVVYPIITQRIPIKGGPRASYIKLLEALRYGRKEITHPAMVLGEAFVVVITHNDNGKEGKERRVYANIKDGSGNWQVSAPVNVDAEGETNWIKAPEATVDQKCLLWTSPDMEQWDSLFIGGTKKTKVNGEEKQVSKNWIQETCLEALDYKGSALETLLLQSSNDLPSVSPDTGDEADSDDEPLSQPGDDGPGSDTPDEDESALTPDDSDPLDDLGL